MTLGGRSGAAGHGPCVWQALIEEDVWVVTDGGGSLRPGAGGLEASLFLACPFICFLTTSHHNRNCSSAGVQLF